MRVIIQPTAEAAAEFVAAEIAAVIEGSDRPVLGLATGSTPLAVYQSLIRWYEARRISFENVMTFNLDEYCGLDGDHPQSYRYFMEEHLFSKVNLRPENCYVPDGMADDYVAHCAWYEQQIQNAGGISLQLLGIGRDGHIGFNEPSSSLASRTRIKTLTPTTRDDNARFFGSPDQVPRRAITMGVETILEADQCVLLAVGPHKADAVAAMVEGPITSQVTASALQLHHDTTVVLDPLAAASLKHLDYYRSIEHTET
jgi:glucosamine-6-phosphate deaminase